MGHLTPLSVRPTRCKCRVAAYLATLDDADRAMFASWLAADIEATDIVEHLRAQTPPVYMKADSIRRWRRFECSCQHG